MSSERLLKRLRYWEKGQEDRVARIDAGEYRKSVLSDVARLYNTQKGTVLIAEDMGLPDFTSLVNNFGARETAIMEQAFKEVTERYEPRLRNVSARFLPRDNSEYGVLRFAVNGTLGFRNQQIPMEFNAVVQGNGSVTVEG